VDHDLSVGHAYGNGSSHGVVTGGAPPVGVDAATGAAVSGDIATGAATSGDIDIAVLDGIEQELADVELALERLGDGTYGRCETCGQVATDDELASAPAGRFCGAHLPLDLS